MGRADAPEPCHWGLQWGSLLVMGVPYVVARAHVDLATRAVGGAPHGVTKRVRDVLQWVARTHVNHALGAFGGAPYGTTKR
eukprot:265172-Pyramimonas_sp.AAC.1